MQKVQNPARPAITLVVLASFIFQNSSQNISFSLTMRLLSILVTCSAALAFALPQDPAAEVVAAPDDADTTSENTDAASPKPEDPVAEDSKPADPDAADPASDALNNFSPSSFIPEGLDKFIPDSITINQNFPDDNRPLPPPPPPQQPWQQPWRQQSWRPTPPQDWFQPRPARGQLPAKCRNIFPNGINPAVGPTDCAQIIDPWCNPNGQGYVYLTSRVLDHCG